MYQLWSQDNFTRGELSPFLYAKAQTASYYNGLKTAQNVLCYPTGAAGKRFGTLFNSVLNNAITNANQIFFQTFQWFDNCIFQLVFRPLAIDIYLEGILVNVVTTTFDAQTVFNLDYTVLGGAFRVAGANITPFDLTVAADGGNVITGVSTDFLTLTSSLVTGIVVPIQFTNVGGSLPTSSPQIKPGVTYFANQTTSSTIEVYADPTDAKFRNFSQRFTFTASSGSGTNTVFTFNTWTFAATTFKNLPFYDFNGATVSYDALTFTPSATTGLVTITVSGAGYSPLNSSYVGGAFIGGGGSGRITAVASATSFTVAVQDPFDSTNAIQGSLVLLAEPAWSTARGWPQKCSSYQNRALFANSVSLPNGFWTSVINDYRDFGDMTTDDDDAISWFPSSSDVNVIRFLVPFRSITVHTNTGIYSSPLAEIAAITPSSFTLQLQDSTPADVLQPQAIDNQIIVIAGNDAHAMVWDGINNAYTTNIISIPNEQTIRTPVDEAAFADLTRAGSRYVFIINANGSMAILQTLIAEQVLGITPAIMEQSYGNSAFLQVASSKAGRCWFVCQRQYAAAQAPIAISGFTANTLAATGIQAQFNSSGPTAITFTTTGTLPAATPALTTTQYYWSIATDANDFQVYLDQDDAIAGVNQVMFTSAGTSSNVVPWPLAPIFTLEELNQDIQIDCAIQFGSIQGPPASTFLTGIIFNAQDVVMWGDGFGFEAQGFGNNVVFDAHGSPVNVQNAFIGYPINLIIEPMPLTAPPNQNTTLTKPKHIRSIRFMFNNTIGGEINGVPIALDPFDMADIGLPPIASSGFVELMIMSGWDDFNQPSFTITHSDPFNIELLGLFYSVDT